MGKLNIKKDSIAKLKWHKHKFSYKLKGIKASIGFDERYMNKSHMFTDKRAEQEILQTKILQIDNELEYRITGINKNECIPIIKINGS